MSSAAKRYAVRCAATVLGLMVCLGVGYAETEPAPAEPVVSPTEAKTPEEAIGPEEEAGPTVAITPTGLVTFDFREAPIRDVLRLFARQVNINIVATPSVQGMVNMKLDNVKWRKALETILQVNKLKLTEDKENNIIKVMTEAEVAAEPMTTKVYSLKYLQAADYDAETLDYDKDGKKLKTTKKVAGASTMLKKLLAENEIMEADPGGNKLIVHAIPASHDKLQAAIDELDKQTMQVLIEVKFIEATAEAGRNLGIKWDFLKEYGVQMGNIGQTYEKAIGKTFDTSSSGSDVGKLAEKVSSSGQTSSNWARSLSDTGSSTTSSETGSSGSSGTTGATSLGTTGKTRLYDADTSEGHKWENSTDTTTTGTSNTTTTGTSGTTGADAWKVTGAAGSSLTRDYASGALSSFSRDVTRDVSNSLTWARGRKEATNTLRTADLSADSVKLVLSALFEDTDTKLISNPRISTVNNKQAVIRAVKEWPIPKWTYNSQTGGWEVQGFDYKDIGITLKVTPHINQDNFITLDVDPEVSNQVGVTTFGGGAGGTAEIPIVDSRNATTRVVVKSGETLVIGGLIRTDETVIKSGVPLLKDIPVLGYLFKHSSKELIKSDLMVFITPTIVEGPGAAVLAPPAEFSEKAAEAPKQ
jgi:type IV pilus assembly protein PilQ